MTDTPVAAVIPVELLQPKRLGSGLLREFGNNQLAALQATQQFLIDLDRANSQPGELQINRNQLPLELASGTAITDSRVFVSTDRLKQDESGPQAIQKVAGTLFPDDIAQIADGILAFVHTISPKAQFSFSTFREEWGRQRGTFDEGDRSQLFTAYKQAIGDNIPELLEHIEFLIQKLSQENSGLSFTTAEAEWLANLVSQSSLSTVLSNWDNYIFPLIDSLRSAENRSDLYFVTILNNGLVINGQRRTIVAVDDLLTIFNRYSEAIGKLIDQQPDVKKLVPEIYQDQSLQQLISRLTFNKVHSTSNPDSVANHQQLAGEYVTALQDIIDYLSGKKKVEQPAETAAGEAEAEDDGGGDVDETPQTPPQSLEISDILDRAKQIFGDTIVETSLQSLREDGQLNSLTAPQRDQLFEFVETLFTDNVTDQDLKALIEPLLRPNAVGFPEGAYVADTNSYIVNQDLIKYVADQIAPTFLQAYDEEITAEIERLSQESAEPPVGPTPIEPEAPTGPIAPTAVVPQLSFFTQEYIEQKTGRGFTAAEYRKVAYLRQSLYIQLFGPDLAFDEAFLGSVNDYLLEQIIVQVRTNPNLSSSELLIKLLQNQQLMLRVEQHYLKQLPVLLSSGTALKNTELAIDTLLAITDDPATFLNNLSDEEFLQYFGFAVTGAERQRVIKLLAGYYYWRRASYYQKGLTKLTPLMAGTNNTVGEIKRATAEVRFFANKLEASGNDINILELLNAESDYLEKLDEKKRSYIVNSERELINWVFTDPEIQSHLRAVLEQQYDVLGIPEGETNLLQYIPAGVSAASLIHGATVHQLQSGKLGKGKLNTLAAKGLGKGVLAGASVLFPEAAPFIKGFQEVNQYLKNLIGLDLEEKLGNIIKILLAGGAILLHGFLTSVGAMIGLIGGIALTPFIGPVALVAGPILGFTAEKMIVGQSSALGGAVDSVRGLLKGSTSVGQIGGKLGINLGSSEFIARFSVIGTVTAATVGGSVVQNLQRSSLARPTVGEGSSLIGTNGDSRICWPADGVVTVTDIYGTAAGDDLAGKKHLTYTMPSLGGKGYAIDIATSGNVYAPFSGTITYYNMFGTGPLFDPSGSSAGYYIILHGDNGINAGFFHLSPAQPLPNNSHVNPQQVIGTADTTGNAHGAHLHYEVWGHPITYPDGVAAGPFQVLGAPISHNTCRGSVGGSQNIAGEQIDCVNFRQIADGPDKDSLYQAVEYLQQNHPKYLAKVCGSGNQVTFLRDGSNGSINANSGSAGGTIIFYDQLFSGTSFDNVLYTVTHELGHQVMFFNPSIYAQFQANVCSLNNPFPFYSSRQVAGSQICVEDFAETAAIYVDIQKNNTPRYVEAMNQRSAHQQFINTVLFN